MSSVGYRRTGEGSLISIGYAQERSKVEVRKDDFATHRHLSVSEDHTSAPLELMVVAETPIHEWQVAVCLRLSFLHMENREMLNYQENLSKVKKKMVQRLAIWFSYAPSSFHL